MSGCPHYNEHRQVLRSREVTGSRQARSKVVIIPWCSHDRSPADRRMVKTVIGGANLLRCGGDLAKCQVEGGIGALPGS